MLNTSVHQDSVWWMMLCCVLHVLKVREWFPYHKTWKKADHVQLMNTKMSLACQSQSFKNRKLGALKELYIGVSLRVNKRWNLIRKLFLSSSSCVLTHTSTFTASFKLRPHVRNRPLYAYRVSHITALVASITAWQKYLLFTPASGKLKTAHAV